MDFTLFVILGTIAGGLGSLIGAGGGFIVVPMMLMMYPDMKSEEITAISLCVVFFNGLMGSVSYALMKRIDYATGFVIILAAAPSAVIASRAVKMLPAEVFGLIFGIFLIILSCYMLTSKVSETESEEGMTTSRIRAVPIGLAAGLVSGLLGIGGGTIQVPMMMNMMKINIKTAVATSVFSLAFVSVISNIGNLTGGVVLSRLEIIVPLSIGALAGAKIGTSLSKVLSGGTVKKLLIGVMIIVGLRLILKFFV